MRKCPILICTVGSPSLEITLSSIKLYAKDAPIYLSSRAKTMDERIYRWVLNSSGNFGDAYNTATDYAFEHGKYESVILINDDVVLNPYTIRLMTHDAGILESKDVNFGFLGARSDYVLHDQNIRFPVYDDRQEGLRCASLKLPSFF